MNQYLVFLKKELLESLRNFKFMLLVIIFTIFGVLSPLTAKLMPVIMKSAMPKEFNIVLPEPSGLDSWQQFFKNLQQMGLLVVILMFSSSLVHELAKGTLINLLTKGLSRKVVILAKFSVMVLLWTMSVMFSFVVTLLYNRYYFPTSGIYHLEFSVFCLWLFGVFLFSVILFSSVIVSSTYGVLLITSGVLGGGLFLNLFQKIWHWNVFSLVAKNVTLLKNEVLPKEFIITIGLTFFLIVIFLLSTLLIFDKKEL